MDSLPCPTHLIAFAERMADASGEVLRRYFRTPVKAEDKPDLSPVTIADRETENVLRAMIEVEFPDHGVIGEEFGASQAEAEYVWTIDPLDGTAGFITGKPLFGTLIGLLHEGIPIFGVIDHPIPGERWTGGAGLPARYNGKRSQTRACADISQAMLYATTPHMFVGADVSAFARLCESVKRPQYGIDCYAYGLLASGFVDLVAEATMKPCDYCALAPVVEAAGGVITDWTGKPLRLDSDGRVLAAGDPRVHAQALAVLRQEDAS